MSDLLDELRLIGCHSNGDARCTCGIGQDAADEIERLRAALTAISEIADQSDGGDWDEIEDARRIARKALATKETKIDGD